jgi:2-iminobutanoate/2-iminopropanoate deaminase
MMKKIIRTDNAPAPIGPYNQAVEAGGFVFVSGQIPLDTTTGQIITGDIKAETKKVMDNIGAVLTKAGLKFSDIVKTSIFLTDM